MRKEIQPDKLRDMVRSILPSKNREAARKGKAIVKRRARRGIRADLRNEDAETTRRDLVRDVSLTDLVRWRRDGDKLNHFMRWCERMTRGMAKQDALAFVRSILPRNLIGDHAYFHWQGHLRGGRYRDSRARYQQSMIDSTRHALRRALEIEPDLLGRFNALVKSRKDSDQPRRLLHGVHDIDAFVATIFAGDPPTFQWPCLYGIERKVLLDLLEE